MAGPSGRPSDLQARERVLSAVPGLEELLEHGQVGEQVQSDALAAGDADEAWLLWFIRQPYGLAVAVPVAGVRGDAVAEALERCNALNAAMDWGVACLVSLGGEEVAVLSVRLALDGEAGDVWGVIGQAMQFVVEGAGSARERFRDLVELGQ